MLLAVMTVSSALATDWEELVLNQDYTITNSVALIKRYYTLTAPSSGTLTIVGNMTVAVYSAETMDDEEKLDATFSWSGSLKKYETVVEQGTTYYLYIKVSETEMTFTASILDENEAPTLTDVYPAVGDELDMFYYGYVSFNFSRAVELGTAVLSCDGASAEVEVHYTMGTYSVDIKSIVYGWLTDGSLAGGGDVTLTISDVHAEGNSANVYGSDGTLTLSWTCPASLTMLDSYVVPTTFLSWWEAGDSDGIAVFTYTGELLQEGNEAHAYIGFGAKETEDDEYYSEDVPVVISGNTLTIDFTGVDRTRDTMLPSRSYDYTIIYLTVSTVQAADGNYIFTESSGSIGSVNANIDYEDIGAGTASDDSSDDEQSGDGDGIILPALQSATSITYNLAGQRFGATSGKGVQIVDGKKLVK